MKWNAARTSHPTTLDQYEAIDRLSFFAQHVILAIDHVTRRASQLFGEWSTQRLAGDST